MIFITGGVRSGKSSFAERLAIEKAIEINGQLHYIATGAASDEEMKGRIARHQRERAASGRMWKTWEQPVGIKVLAPSFRKGDIVLLDCVTTLLNNELFSIQGKWSDDFLEGLFKRIIAGIEGIGESCQELILVSNEVLYEPLKENEIVVRYSRILGNLHQALVRKADTAILVESGIPIFMKGERR